MQSKRGIQKDIISRTFEDRMDILLLLYRPQILGLSELLHLPSFKLSWVLVMFVYVATFFKLGISIFFFFLNQCIQEYRMEQIFFGGLLHRLLLGLVLALFWASSYKTVGLFYRTRGSQLSKSMMRFKFVFYI